MRQPCPPEYKNGFETSKPKFNPEKFLFLKPYRPVMRHVSTKFPQNVYFSKNHAVAINLPHSTLIAEALKVAGMVWVSELGGVYLESDS